MTIVFAVLLTLVLAAITPVTARQAVESASKALIYLTGIQDEEWFRYLSDHHGPGVNLQGVVDRLNQAAVDEKTSVVLAYGAPTLRLTNGIFAGFIALAPYALEYMRVRETACYAAYTVARTDHLPDR